MSAVTLAFGQSQSDLSELEMKELRLIEADIDATDICYETPNDFKPQSTARAIRKAVRDTKLSPRIQSLLLRRWLPEVPDLIAGRIESMEEEKECETIDKLRRKIAKEALSGFSKPITMTENPGELESMFLSRFIAEALKSSEFRKFYGVRLAKK